MYSFEKFVKFCKQSCLVYKFVEICGVCRHLRLRACMCACARACWHVLVHVRRSSRSHGGVRASRVLLVRDCDPRRSNGLASGGRQGWEVICGVAARGVATQVITGVAIMGVAAQVIAGVAAKAQVGSPPVPGIPGATTLIGTRTWGGEGAAVDARRRRAIRTTYAWGCGAEQIAP
jgi:hypothetical protein